MTTPGSAPRYCVIGAGAAGLAALRTLSDAGLDVDCFERSDRVGGHWHTDYESLHLITSRDVSGFSGCRHALDPGFTAVLLGSAATTKVFATERAENVRAIASLFERARRDGVLRPDLTIDDVLLVLAATSAVFAPSPARALEEVRRLAALLLQGMRARPTVPPEPMPARGST